MLVEVILIPQQSDMGSGFGKYTFSKPLTLDAALNWFKNNLNDWGTITIYYKDSHICRQFDYDTYNDKQFYYHLSWELSILVQAIDFSYCYMNRDITITLEK